MDNILEVTGLVKRYPSFSLDNISFSLPEGCVTGFIGANGAGKTTTIRSILGLARKNAGVVKVFGLDADAHEQEIKDRIGIVMDSSYFYNDLSMKDMKSIVAPAYSKWSDADYRLYMEKFELDPKQKISTLSRGMRMKFALVLALSHNAELLIMDEPTAALSGVEIEQLFAIIRRLKAKGVGIVYISHRMQEIPQIGDRITIMRDGQHIHTCNVSDITNDEIVSLMVGRQIGKLYQRSEHTSGEVMLKVEHLNAKKERLQDISMEVHAGEIVGLSGLVGAGRTELVRAIFHVDPYESGTITLKGEEISRKATTHEMIEKGVSLIPEDRKRQGLSLILPISQNIVMASLDRLSPRLWIQKKAEKKVIDQYIKELNIITPSSEQKANNLSGGNQQKVVLAKWLCTQADVIIFDEPTRGIDVGAKKEIYSFMDNLTKQGKAIIMIYSEMPEIIGMSDRIYVMRDRKIVKELKAEEATQELILSYALEGAREEDEHAEA